MIEIVTGEDLGPLAVALVVSPDDRAVLVAPAGGRKAEGDGKMRLPDSLAERICSEPTLRNVASIELVCQPELVPLYEKWGFSENAGRSRLMRRTSDPLLADADEPPTRVVDCSATAPRWSAQHYVCDEGEELRGGLMSKKTHHVVPNQSGGWSVRKGGASRASKVFDRQSEAIDYAKDLAKKNSSELYVHRTDGTIREKSSYGNDPNPPKDKK